MSGKTPYQGKKKAFGEYKCPEDENKWASCCSWANTGQGCKECGKTVYPHKQRPLEKPKDNANTGGAHSEDLCGKCKELGHKCNQH